MRLIKINDMILNLDQIVVIKGEECYNLADELEHVKVRAYTESANSVVLGRCDDRESYGRWISALYDACGTAFPHEIIFDEDKELWE